MIKVNNKLLINPLVCDTNIWYDIADGNISPNALMKYSMIGTGINISEFASTSKLINNPRHLVRALKAMHQYHALIIKSNFMDHMMSLFDESFESNDTTNDRLLDGFSTYMQIDIDEIPIDNIEKASRQIDEIRRMKDETTSAFNVKIPEIRQIIKDSGGKKVHRKKDFFKSHRKFFSDLLSIFSNHYYHKDFRIPVEDSNWTKLDFFIRTWDEYFRSMELSHNMKLQGNDFADLFNLVYVQPGVRYTTRERKWITLFKSDEVLSEYFIEL